MELGEEIADSEKLEQFKAGLTGREREFVYFGRPRTYEDAKDIALSVGGAPGGKLKGSGPGMPSESPTTSIPTVWVAATRQRKLNCNRHGCC